MSFQDAVRTVLQQKYADFTGRASRPEFWYFFLFQFIAGIVANILNAILHLPTFGGGSTTLGILLNLALLVPSLAVSARRLHDIGRSGWWWLIALTGVGIILLIIWWAQPGKPEANQHGPALTAGQAY